MMLMLRLQLWREIAVVLLPHLLQASLLPLLQARKLNRAGHPPVLLSSTRRLQSLLAPYPLRPSSICASRTR
jgi:hypothetical protein